MTRIISRMVDVIIRLRKLVRIRRRKVKAIFKFINKTLKNLQKQSKHPRLILISINKMTEMTTVLFFRRKILETKT